MMLWKLVFLVVFMILSQPLEAKKKKQNSCPIATVSTYVRNVGDFLQDAWEALLDLLPEFPKTSPTKTKKNKNKQDTLDLNYYVKSATKNIKHLYKSVSNSMGMFQFGRSSEKEEPDLESVLFVEFLAAEVLEKVTWAFVNIASSIDKNKLIPTN